MNGFTFCFLQPDGTKVCVDIPVLIRDRIGPDPDPWINFHDAGINEVAQNLRALAQIDQAVSRLSDSAIARPLQDAVQGALKDAAQKLPADVTVELAA